MTRKINPLHFLGRFRIAHLKEEPAQIRGCLRLLDRSLAMHPRRQLPRTQEMRFGIYVISQPLVGASDNLPNGKFNFGLTRELALEPLPKVIKELADGVVGALGRLRIRG